MRALIFPLTFLNFLFQIVVVDDEVSIRKLCKRILKNTAEVIDLVESAEEAIKNINNKVYDVILLDIYLPGIQGDEFLRKIKDEYPLTEIIIITGRPDIDTAIETLKNEAFDYVIKPFTSDELKDVVEKAIAEHRKKIEIQLQNISKDKRAEEALKIHLIIAI